MPFLLALLFCGCDSTRGALAKRDLFAEILRRESLREIGNDGFFENSLLQTPYPEVRQWSAIALGRIASLKALPLLYRALHEGDAAVRAASAFAVGEIEDRNNLQKQHRDRDPVAAAELIRLLDDPSLTVQMRAVEALGKIGSYAEAAEITQRMENFSYKKLPAERVFLDFSITALVRLGDSAATAVFDILVGSDDPRIRQRASDALVRLQSRFPATTIAEDPSLSNTPISEAFCRALADFRNSSTIAMLDTTRGPIEIELFREDAPLTVAHFVMLAERGAYNALEFDSSIPLQLIGGRSPRMKSGLRSTIVSEVNMRPFERGSVGAALAGGYSEMGEVFIALTPQPYLDGIHTCFGRVLSGMQVADRIVAGDRIKHVVIKETVPALTRQRY